MTCSLFWALRITRNFAAANWGELPWYFRFPIEFTSPFIHGNHRICASWIQLWWAALTPSSTSWMLLTDEKGVWDGKSSKLVLPLTTPSGLCSPFLFVCFVAEAITFWSERSTCPTNRPKLREVTSTRVLPWTHSFAHFDTFSYYQAFANRQPTVTTHHTGTCKPFFWGSPAVRPFQQTSWSQFTLALF